jgi:hypothetical protein
MPPIHHLSHLHGDPWEMRESSTERLEDLCKDAQLVGLTWVWAWGRWQKAGAGRHQLSTMREEISWVGAHLAQRVQQTRRIAPCHKDVTWLFWLQKNSLKWEGEIRKDNPPKWKALGIPLYHFLTFLVILDFELWASCFLGRQSYCLSHSISSHWLLFSIFSRSCYKKSFWNK